MKLRQAEKIVKRASIEAYHNRYYGTPLPKSWKRIVSMLLKARAVCNHHAIPFGRMANKWYNDNAARMAKESKEKE